MNLVLVQPDDEEEDVKQLLAACELPYQDITAEHLRDFLSLRDGPRLAGVIGLEVFGQVALLRSLAVAPPYRGQGLGSQLTREAEAYARSRGVETLYLLTTTADDFFAERGYRRTERAQAPHDLQETAEFRSLCPNSAVCMVKQLS